MSHLSSTTKSRRFFERMAIPVFLTLLSVCIGVTGYYLLWEKQGGTLIDALYMTIITMATIGYNEVLPLDERGRVFTIVLAIIGVGSLLYVMTALMDYLVQLELYGQRETKKIQKKVGKMENHIILVGLGRVGKHAALELKNKNEKFVAIDKSPEAAEYAKKYDFPLVCGDATDDEALLQCEIQNARGLIAATPDDAANTFIVISARSLNPSLKIISRAEEETSIKKLERAGADRAITPQLIGGQQLVNLMVHPSIVNFLESALGTTDNSLQLESMSIVKGSLAVGRTIGRLNIRQKTGANVLVVIRDNAIISSPMETIQLAIDDNLIAIGSAEQLRRLEQILIRPK